MTRIRNMGAGSLCVPTAAQHPCAEGTFILLCASSCSLIFRSRMRQKFGRAESISFLMPVPAFLSQFCLSSPTFPSPLLPLLLLLSSLLHQKHQGRKTTLRAVPTTLPDIPAYVRTTFFVRNKRHHHSLVLFSRATLYTHSSAA